MITAARRSFAVVLACVLLAGALVTARAAPSTAADARLDRAEAKQKSRIAKVWLDLARYLETRDLKTEAETALGKARVLDPDLDGLKDLEGKAAALEGKGEADASSKDRIEKAAHDAAKDYDRLADLFKKKAGDARLGRYLVEALVLEPTKARTMAVAGEAQKGPLLLGSPTHPLVAWVTFPRSWRPGRKTPVLVSVEGAGCNFLGNARQFSSARGSRDYITVSPHALSCTNEIDPAKYPGYDEALVKEWDSKRLQFDVPGLLALLDFLRDRFDAEEKVAITGFSGGGMLCYAFVLRHPDRVLCAAPACANFNPSCADGAKTPEEGGPPVHMMTGEKDPNRELTHGKFRPGIEEQADWAEKALKEHGFTHVTRTMLPGVGHAALPKQVWDFVDETTGAKPR